MCIRDRLTTFEIGINSVSWLLIRFMLVMVPVVLFINGFTNGDWLDASLFASVSYTHLHVVRVVALSGGYDREQANGLLRGNHGLIASFSRALLSDLSINQTSVEFNTCLENVILQIYRASIV